jgi:uncharacterized membrane protein YbjE (DUF340 family)
MQTLTESALGWTGETFKCYYGWHIVLCLGIGLFALEWSAIPRIAVSALLLFIAVAIGVAYGVEQTGEFNVLLNQESLLAYAVPYASAGLFLFFTAE